MCIRFILMGLMAIVIAGIGSPSAHAMAPAATAGIASITDASAHSGTTLVQGRKGTRNYQPDSGDVSQSTADTTDPSASAVDELAHCVDLWDQETHMTKRDWETTCRRVLHERAAMQPEM